MQAPLRRRPKRQNIALPRPQAELDELAARATYMASGEHKTAPAMGVQPIARADASKCDPAIRDVEQVTGWLREGIRSGRIGGIWQGDFPRYVWHHVGDQWYEAFLTNPALGQYKGYPTESHLLPLQLQRQE